MTGNEYQKLASRTNDKMSTDRLLKTMENRVMMNQHIDSIKHMFVPTSKTDVAGILNACLGLSGEVGEFNDIIKKWIFHEKPLDTEHLKKELGDVMWYVAMMCESFGWELDEILQMNVDKLKARYPEGFDVTLANNRKEGDI